MRLIEKQQIDENPKRRSGPAKEDAELDCRVRLVNYETYFRIRRTPTSAHPQNLENFH
jgi:hypothetical protein